MILVIGGQSSGKRDYVRSLGFTDDDASVLFDLHLLLKDTPEVTDALFETLAHKRVVTCNETGCGIVPMDASERAYRDRVGRTCARLAERAKRVVRLTCGIPLCIKNEESETE